MIAFASPLLVPSFKKFPTASTIARSRFSLVEFVTCFAEDRHTHIHTRTHTREHRACWDGVVRHRTALDRGKRKLKSRQGRGDNGATQRREVNRKKRRPLEEKVADKKNEDGTSKRRHEPLKRILLDLPHSREAFL